jgi:hypothetical protein
VLLDENGRLKLGGFGLSRRLSDINKTSVTNLPPVRGGLCELQRVGRARKEAAGSEAARQIVEQSQQRSNPPPSPTSPPIQ